MPAARCPLSTALHTTFHRRHDDFVDGAFLNWDGTEGMSGGNHEFRELLESLVGGKLREVDVALTVSSIEWHSALHSSGVDDVLDACDAGGVQGLRSFFKSTLMDALSYTGGGNGQRVVDTIVAQLCAKYHAHVEDHPGGATPPSPNPPP